MKLKNIIGGLGSVVVSYRGTYYGYQKTLLAHNQLCNREVEYKDTWVGYHIGTILSYLSEKHKIQITEKDDDLIQEQMEAIAKAISEGKVLRVVE